MNEIHFWSFPFRALVLVAPAWRRACLRSSSFATVALPTLPPKEGTEKPRRRTFTPVLHPQSVPEVSEGWSTPKDGVGVHRAGSEGRRSPGKGGILSAKAVLLFRNQSPLRQKEYSFSENQSPLRQKQYSFSENQSAFSGKPSRFLAKKSSFSRKQYSFSENQSPISQKLCSFLEKESRFPGKQSPFSAKARRFFGKTGTDFGPCWQHFRNFRPFFRDFTSAEAIQSHRTPKQAPTRGESAEMGLPGLHERHHNCAILGLTSLLLPKRLAAFGDRQAFTGRLGVSRFGGGR